MAPPLTLQGWHCYGCSEGRRVASRNGDDDDEGYAIEYGRQNCTVRRAVPAGQSCGAPAVFGKTPMVTVLEAVRLAQAAPEPPKKGAQRSRACYELGPKCLKAIINPTNHRAKNRCILKS